MFITIILHRNAKRQLRLDVLRSIDAQWQDLNKLMATNPQLLAAIGDKTMKGASEAEIIRMNIIYYVLNTFQQVLRAHAQGYISKDTAEVLKEGHRHFFHLFPDEVERVIHTGLGFDKSALSELGKYLKQN